MSQHILVVDDDQAILDVLTELLSQEGYRVTACLTVAHAQQVVRVDRPTAIILDYLFDRQPHGEMWLAVLQSDAALRTIPIVFCTAALHAVPTLAPSLAFPHIVLLHKPFTVDQVLAALTQVLAVRGASAISNS